MRFLKNILFLLLILPFVLLLPDASFSAPKKKKEIKYKVVTPEEIGVLKTKEVQIVQKMLFRKEKRHDVGLFGAIQFNDPWVRPILLGLSYTWHLKEKLGVEVIPFSWGFKVTTSAWETITNDPYNPGEGYYPDANRILINSQVNAVYSPIYAKLNFFSLKVIHFDMYGLAGIGYSATRRLLDEDERGGLLWSEVEHYPAFNIGIGQRFFVNRWMTLKLEARDIIFFEKVRSTGGSKGQNHILIYIGYSFYLPTYFK